MPYAFKSIPDGIAHIGKGVIAGGFESVADAESYALAWFEQGKMTVMYSEPDGDDAIDIVAAKGLAVFQYAIEKEA